MKTYTLQYIDEGGQIRIAYVKAHTKEEACQKFKKGEY